MIGPHPLRAESVIRRILAAIHPISGGHLHAIGPGRETLMAGLLSAADHPHAVRLDYHPIEPLAGGCGRTATLIYHSSTSPWYPAMNRRWGGW